MNRYMLKNWFLTSAYSLLLLISVFSASSPGQTENFLEQENLALVRFLFAAQHNHSLAEEIGLTREQKKSINSAIERFNQFSERHRKVLYPSRSEKPVSAKETKAIQQQLLGIVERVVIKKFDEVLLPRQILRARELVRQSQHQNDSLINNMQSPEMIDRFKIPKARLDQLDFIRERTKDEIRELRFKQRREIVELLKKRDKLIKEQLGAKERKEYDEYFGKPVSWYAEQVAAQKLRKWSNGND